MISVALGKQRKVTSSPRASALVERAVGESYIKTCCHSHGPKIRLRKRGDENATRFPCRLAKMGGKYNLFFSVSKWTESFDFQFCFRTYRKQSFDCVLCEKADPKTELKDLRIFISLHRFPTDQNHRHTRKGKEKAQEQIPGKERRLISYFRVGLLFTTPISLCAKKISFLPFLFLARKAQGFLKPAFHPNTKMHTDGNKLCFWGTEKNALLFPSFLAPWRASSLFFPFSLGMSHLTTWFFFILVRRKHSFFPSIPKKCRPSLLSRLYRITFMKLHCFI